MTIITRDNPLRIVIKDPEAVQLFHLLSPFIEKAGYTWQAHNRVAEMATDVVIYPNANTPD